MDELPRGVERSVKLYESLVRVYPASFRRKFGGEMVLVFRDLTEEAWRRRGRIGLLIVWFRVMADLVRSAPKEHVSSWITDEGGMAMKFNSLLTRRFSSDESDHRLGQIVALGYAVLIPPFLIWRFLSMNLTDPQLFLGILLVVSLTMQMLGTAMLLSWVEPKFSFRSPSSLCQIVIYAISILWLISGVWTLSTMTISEFELVFGVLLILNVSMGGIILGVIFPIMQDIRARRREKRQEC
jgi:hypothetical protein